MPKISKKKAIEIVGDKDLEKKKVLSRPELMVKLDISYDGITKMIKNGLPVIGRKFHIDLVEKYFLERGLTVG